MRETYRTPALVLTQYPRGEGHLSVCLFTKDLGVLYATAQSARHGQAKLQSALQVFSYTDMSLVRGKGVWRVTGAVLEENFYQTLRGKPRARLLSARFLHLLKNIPLPETPTSSDMLWEMIMETFSMFINCRDEDVDMVERVSIYRLLALLGYASREVLPVAFTQASVDELCLAARKEGQSLVRVINEGIHATA